MIIYDMLNKAGDDKAPVALKCATGTLQEATPPGLVIIYDMLNRAGNDKAPVALKCATGTFARGYASWTGDKLC